MTAKRILYIEDNFQNRRLVKKLLRLSGYEMLEAEDGLQGIAIAAREHPDLILMDINLPGIDGMEATSRLKSSSDLGNIPIVALTAAAMRGDRERIIAAGCDGYLQKPIDNVLLINTVRSFIGTAEAVAVQPPSQETRPANGTGQTVVVESPQEEPRPSNEAGVTAAAQAPQKEAHPSNGTGEAVAALPPQEETHPSNGKGETVVVHHPTEEVRCISPINL